MDLNISTKTVPVKNLFKYISFFLDAGITYQGFVMSDAVTATDEGQQEKLFRQAGNIIEKSLEKVRIEFFTLVFKTVSNVKKWMGLLVRMNW